MNNNSGYIKSLDGLRAIAIILVMSFHAEIIHFGWFGVQLFFVLSGFLITGILWKEKQNTASSLSFKFKKFWIRRSLRIFPLYFGYLLFITLTYLLFHFPSYYSNYAPYLFTYTFNYTRSLPEWQGNPLFTHLWSLSTEEQFYLFFPLIMLLCPQRFTKTLMIAVIFVSPVTRFFLGEYYAAKGMTEPVVADTVYWNTLSHLDAFFMGGLIPVLSLDKKIKKPQRVFTLALVIAIIAGIINFANTDSGKYYFNDLGYNCGQTHLYQHVWHYTVLNFLFASFILALISYNSNKAFASIRKLLEANWMVNVGKVSYGMYLFHWSILEYVCNRVFTTDNLALKAIVFIPYVMIVYLVATLSFRFYESRFLKLKDSLFAKGRNKKNNFPDGAACFQASGFKTSIK
ncbi:acyltransferase family protein [Parafilimonas sp.]|uniref:acyltransferase family protein n=1 Tax=Parafilimonas sp. TaxID=1969739 RepID=UPI0039E35B56